jgi:hypothetical protein
LEALKGAGFPRASSFWLLSLNSLVVATGSQERSEIGLIFCFIVSENTKSDRSRGGDEEKSPVQEPPQGLLSLGTGQRTGFWGDAS